MHMRRFARAAVAAVGLAAMAATPAAAAGTKLIEPLNQYVVSGRINPEDLARAGYDLTEARAPGPQVRLGHHGHGHAGRRPDRQGRDGAPAGTRAHGRRRGAQPAHRPRRTATTSSGPWSLTPAPCPQTCATPNVPLKQWYADLAAHNTDVVKTYVIRQERPRPGHRRLQGHQERAQREGRQPSGRRLQRHPARARVDLGRGRAPALQVRRREQEPEVRQQGQGPARQERAVVRPDHQPGRLRLHLHLARHALLAQEPARQQQRRRDHQRRRRRHQPQLAEKWNYDLEGASDEPSSETFHGSGPASEPEVKALRGLIKRIRPSFQIDYHSFAQLILYPEGWQVETPSTDEPLMAKLAGDDDHPAVAGLRPGRVGRALHDQRRRHRRHLQGLQHARLHGRARRRHRPGGRRHRRHRSGLHARRLRLPGLRGRHPAQSRRTSRSRWT